ncbi:hypothetical protein P3342_000308 [Pyrenophora teres f. teres]|uniref:Rhodopsin domain-containing protein n=2 Tax=Pyrenophora teres f. teres TaxID=97479 RepID=E3RGK6_PYRTT|nr:hypothetical protein PTT_06941 [Pyrenophora teres f. teres 0-1]KAE8836492.1 hypothetical protein HRS9139_04590 [Pyrenophora teres f. teres]KAE8837537.1 hypothetical protein PTNB85_04872 [Pyrenophora teres f. teres]KAE8840043.1 hypothetical protein HRS9122_06648 [Pyrenophora teres f. teres]KAE8862363.1 hypothetical protein PTNB29_04925 [Pyrenophora teres f. teres]
MAGSLSGNPRGEQAVQLSSAFTALAFTIVCLRLYTRIYIIRCAGIEDFGIAVAMFCSIGLTICIGVQAQYGMGWHIADVSHEAMTKFLKSFWSSLIFYYLSLGLTKGSILLQYKRIFTTRKFLIANYLTMGVVVGYTFWTVFSSIFECVPIRAFWTREPAKCLNQFAVWFTNAGINILTDFAIIILPIPVIRSLNLGRKQKIGLIAIFAVGGLVCIVSILRLHSLVAISNSPDPTYDNPAAATWSSVEANVGIICACLPILRPLVTQWFPRAFTSRHPSQFSRPQNATYGSRGGSNVLRTKESFALNTTRTTRTTRTQTSEEGRDIQVVTDIHVQVEGEPDTTSDWKPSSSPKDWSETTSVKNVEQLNSTEQLVPVPEPPQK